MCLSIISSEGRMSVKATTVSSVSATGDQTQKGKEKLVATRVEKEVKDQTNENRTGVQLINASDLA